MLARAASDGGLLVLIVAVSAFGIALAVSCGALPALGDELFTGHSHVVLLCLVFVLWSCCPCTNYFF